MVIKPSDESLKIATKPPKGGQGKNKEEKKMTTLECTIARPANASKVEVIEDGKRTGLIENCGKHHVQLVMRNMSEVLQSMGRKISHEGTTRYITYVYLIRA